MKPVKRNRVEDFCFVIRSSPPSTVQAACGGAGRKPAGAPLPVQTARTQAFPRGPGAQKTPDNTVPDTEPGPAADKGQGQAGDSKPAVYSQAPEHN